MAGNGVYIYIYMCVWVCLCVQLYIEKCIPEGERIDWCFNFFNFITQLLFKCYAFVLLVLYQ